ncbi:MAG TPA: hypothetical protein VJW76_03380, partial [Verrucomicrobiae bacterium]|nr:hypothetical protein [Verrucomicrobiae bacterium]
TPSAWTGMNFRTSPQPGREGRFSPILLFACLLVTNGVSQTHRFAGAGLFAAAAPTESGIEGAPLPAFHENIWFWIAAGFGLLLAGLIVLELKRRLSGSARFPARQSISDGSSSTISQTTYVNRGTDTGDEQPISAPPTETASADISFWRQRAMAAESRAERATAVVRAGLTPHLARMMKDQLVWTLMAQRSRMTSTQDTGAVLVAELEQRLEQIQSEFESRVETYEKRITELQCELETKSQLNKELLGATIDMAKKALNDVAVRHPNSPFASRRRSQQAVEEKKAKAVSPERLSFGDIMARRASKDR